MPTQVQLRRGTTVQHSTFIGAVGEVTVDTDKDTLIVHDGVTAGGNELASNTKLQLSFDAANTANVKAITSGSYANSAYEQANTANSKLYVSGLSLSTNTANQTIDSYLTSEYRTSKYLIQAVSDSSIHSEELIVTHDDYSVYFTEYGVVNTGTNLFQVFASIQSNNVMINVSPFYSNTYIDFSRISIQPRTLNEFGGDLMLRIGIDDFNNASGLIDLNL